MPIERRRGRRENLHVVPIQIGAARRVFDRREVLHRAGLANASHRFFAHAVQQRQAEQHGAEWAACYLSAATNPLRERFVLNSILAN
ncbi:hypothetical protein D3C72_1724520 [compost metagenome]